MYLTSLSTFNVQVMRQKSFPGGSDSKASVYNVVDPGSIPGLGRSPGEGNGNPLQDYCLENPMNRRAWQATVHGVAKSRIQLRDFTSLIRVKFYQNLPGIKPGSPSLQADSLPSEPQGKPKNTGVGDLSLLQRNFLS